MTRRVLLPAMTLIGLLPAYVMTTLTEAVLGLLLGATAGTLLALGVVLWPRAGDALEPLVLLTKTVPTVVLAPLLILWAGFGLLPKVLLVALTVFVPIFISATSAMRSADTDLLDAVAGQSGLGVFIQRSRKAYAVDQVLVGVIGVALLTALLVGVVVLLERAATPWRPRARGAASLPSPALSRPAAHHPPVPTPDLGDLMTPTRSFLTATGHADFAYSVAESLVPARSQGVDAVSVAAIVEHNTSSLVFESSSGITRPGTSRARSTGATARTWRTR